MESAKCGQNSQSSFQSEINLRPLDGESFERRTAHYKPNIWSYDYIESLVSTNNVSLCGAQVQRLKEDFIRVFDQETDASKLQIIDDINKLGLNSLFEKELMKALDVIQIGLNSNNPSSIDNIGSVALCFRLLRQHGYNVSQGLFTEFLAKEGDDKSSNVGPNIKGLIELYEASHLAVEDENSLIKAGDLSHENLKQIHHKNSSDQSLTTHIAHVLELPQHWTVQWFDVRRRIDAYESEVTRNNIPALLKLAKLNFNTVQSVHQKDLRDLTMWWKSLGLIENISFARDRLVESFLWTVGVASEPRCSSLRKCLTKVVTFVLVLDDLYDVFGSLDELECFTKAVESWSWEQTDHLPKCMKICFWALNHTTNDIAKEIEDETGYTCGLPHLRNAWADFCRSLLVEAKWYNKSHTPSLKEYLSSAWISSCGPLLSLVVILMATEITSNEFTHEFNVMKGLVYYSSVIIRLCNDLGTTAAELERGDSPSSVLCYMREANVTEEAARRRIKDIISCTWKKINEEFVKQDPTLVKPANLIINTARVCHFIYNKGDGFGVQDGDTKRQIKRVLVEPVIID